jgi:hypothetical protein
MKFKIVWINLLMKCEYDADLKNGKRAEFMTFGAAERWARKQNRKDGVITGLLREYRVEPIQ